MPARIEDSAVAVYFSVRIDGKELGLFTSLEGLGMEMVVEPREEGGQNAFVHQLPGRVKYTPVKLSRPFTSKSESLLAWFRDLAAGVTRTTGAITALGPSGDVLATWKLEGVFPTKWTGPSFSAENAKAATETLELAHNGFTME